MNVDIKAVFTHDEIIPKRFHFNSNCGLVNYRNPSGTVSPCIHKTVIFEVWLSYKQDKRSATDHRISFLYKKNTLLLMCLHNMNLCISITTKFFGVRTKKSPNMNLRISIISIKIKANSTNAPNALVRIFSLESSPHFTDSLIIYSRYF